MAILARVLFWSSWAFSVWVVGTYLDPPLNELCGVVLGALAVMVLMVEYALWRMRREKL